MRRQKRKAKERPAEPGEPSMTAIEYFRIYSEDFAANPGRAAYFCRTYPEVSDWILHQPNWLYDWYFTSIEMFDERKDVIQ